MLAANAPLFADRVLTSADLLGIVDGFAVLAGSATRPTSAVQLILVDLADPSRIAPVRLPDGGSDSIVGVEIRGVHVSD